MSAIIGVWAAAGSGLLAEVQPGMPLLKLTLRRVKAAALPFYALIPWTTELDHLDAEVRAWGFQTRRTHPDERVAMRDMLAEISDGVLGTIGMLVRAEAAAIDVAELWLAQTRLSNGWEEYASPRITAYPIQRWLKVSDSAEWPEVMGAEQARRFFSGHAMEGSARALAARKEERPKND